MAIHQWERVQQLPGRHHYSLTLIRHSPEFVLIPLCMCDIRYLENTKQDEVGVEGGGKEGEGTHTLSFSMWLPLRNG